MLQQILSLYLWTRTVDIRTPHGTLQHLEQFRPSCQNIRKDGQKDDHLVTLKEVTLQKQVWPQNEVVSFSLYLQRMQLQLLIDNLFWAASVVWWLQCLLDLRQVPIEALLLIGTQRKAVRKVRWRDMENGSWKGLRRGGHTLVWCLLLHLVQKYEIEKIQEDINSWDPRNLCKGEQQNINDCWTVEAIKLDKVQEEIYHLLDSDWRIQTPSWHHCLGGLKELLPPQKDRADLQSGKG